MPVLMLLDAVETRAVKTWYAVMSLAGMRTPRVVAPDMLPEFMVYVLPSSRVTLKLRALTRLAAVDDAAGSPGASVHDSMNVTGVPAYASTIQFLEELLPMTRAFSTYTPVALASELLRLSCPQPSALLGYVEGISRVTPVPY